MSFVSNLTLQLSVALCDGSSRRLIAGWWYFILFISIVQILIAMWAMSSRAGSQVFITTWSSIVLLMVCIGGTIIMRKFQNSTFVGFFMGMVIAASQMFFLLFLVYFGYIEDRIANDLPADEERLTGFLCLVQSIMLGSFAALLAAHRSEILDQKISMEDLENVLVGSSSVGQGGEDQVGEVEGGGGEGDSSYEPPKESVS